LEDGREGTVWNFYWADVFVSNLVVRQMPMGSIAWRNWKTDRKELFITFIGLMCWVEACWQDGCWRLKKPCVTWKTAGGC